MWKDIQGWFDQANYDMLKTITLPKEPTILECGTHEGRSTAVLRELWPDAEIFTCDPGHTPVVDAWFMRKRGQDIKWNRHIDLLFIDALHTYEDTKEIFNKYKKYADIVVFHDYHDQYLEGAEGVKTFVDDLETCELFRDGEFGGAIWRK